MDGGFRIVNCEELHVVTGAFGYTGKYITRRLLARGIRVRTLTGHPDRPNPFGERVEVFPYAFDNPSKLAASLRGATTLYNTYWVRFERGGRTFAGAVRHTLALFQAAKEAGVPRIVHVSITNASAASPLPYFRGKGELDAALRASGVPYAILRPTVIFGPEDILMNNIAWLLRRFPVFGIPGDGKYPIQPVFVEDMAALAVRAAEEQRNLEWDAVGPEVFSFRESVELIAQAIRSRAKIISFSPRWALLACRLVGWAVRDAVLTREEIEGLMAGLLVSQKPPTGWTRMSDWVRANASTLGTKYSSEVARHFA
jgi:NADH dehydrogenase